MPALVRKLTSKAVYRRRLIPRPFKQIFDSVINYVLWIVQVEGLAAATADATSAVVVIRHRINVQPIMGRVLFPAGVMEEERGPRTRKIDAIRIRTLK